MREIKNTIIEWLEEKSPYLVFQIQKEVGRRFSFRKTTFSIQEEAEIIFIEGVQRCFDTIVPFLQKGGQVVFIEESVERISAFLAHPDFRPHDKIDIVTPSSPTLHEMAKAHFFSKKQFVGELAFLKSLLSRAHMIASDYRDYGKRILGNVVSNLTTHLEVVSGLDLKGVYQNIPAIICGSGKSLEGQLETIRKYQGKALIIAAGSAIIPLLKAGISIDYGVIIDPDPPISEYEKVGPLTFPLFFQYRMSRDLFQLHQGVKIFMGDSGMWPLEGYLIKESCLTPHLFESGWNVGNFALHIASFLGCSPIVLIGLDGGEKKTRELAPHEFEVEGYITRQDLYEGTLWMGECAKKFKDQKILRGTKGISIREIPYEKNWKKEISCEVKKVFLPIVQIDEKRLYKALSSLQIQSHKQKIGDFLERFKKPHTTKEFQRQKLLLEVEFLQDPLYDYLLEPLWKIFNSLFTWKGDVAKTLAEFAFYYTVLSVQEIGEVVLRYYPGGALYGVERYLSGKKEGVFKTYFEDGKVRSCISYKNDLLNGDFTLYSKNGVRRKGSYRLGKKMGEHTLYNDVGRLILLASFDADVPKGKYIHYTDEGRIKEEIFYHNSKQFDKKVFTSDGDLKYEAVSLGNAFTEKKFIKGKCVLNRKGKWQEGVLIWD